MMKDERRKLPVVPPSFAAPNGAASFVRRGAEPQARVGHDYAVTGAPGLGWAICQNKEQKTKSNGGLRVFCSLFLVLASPATQEWIALAALPPCSNRRLSESWRAHWLRRCRLVDYNMCQPLAQSAFRLSRLRTTKLLTAIVVRSAYHVNMLPIRTTHYALEIVLQIVL